MIISAYNTISFITPYAAFTPTLLEEWTKPLTSLSESLEGVLTVQQRSTAILLVEIKCLII
jgi:hypothetical protein